jgi:hypothetical protein
MSSYRPTADQLPDATPAQIESARLVTGDAVTEINRLNLNLAETRTFPDGVLLARYETRC